MLLASAIFVGGLLLAISNTRNSPSSPSPIEGSRISSIATLDDVRRKIDQFVQEGDTTRAIEQAEVWLKSRQRLPTRERFCVYRHLVTCLLKLAGDGRISFAEVIPYAEKAVSYAVEEGDKLYATFLLLKIRLLADPCETNILSLEKFADECISGSILKNQAWLVAIDERVRQKQLSQAERCFRRILDEGGKRGGGEDPTLLSIRMRYADLLTALRQKEKALEQIERAWNRLNQPDVDNLMPHYRFALTVDIAIRLEQNGELSKSESILRGLLKDSRFDAKQKRAVKRHLTGFLITRRVDSSMLLLNELLADKLNKVEIVDAELGFASCYQIKGDPARQLKASQKAIELLIVKPQKADPEESLDWYHDRLEQALSVYRDASVNLDKVDEASRYLKYVDEQLRSNSGDKRSMALVDIMRGTIYVSQRKYDEARVHLERAQEHFAHCLAQNYSQRDAEQLVRMIESRAGIEGSLGHTNLHLRMLKEAAAEACRLKGWASAERILPKAAVAAMQRRDWKQVQHYCNQLQKIEGKSVDAEFATRKLLVDLALSKGDRQGTALLYQQLLTWLDTVNRPSLAAEACHSYGVFLLYQDAGKSRFYLEKARDLYKSLPAYEYHNRAMSTCHTQLAKAYQLLGLESQSAAQIETALALAERVQDAQEFKAYQLMDIGRHFISQRRNEKAREYAAQSVELIAGSARVDLKVFYLIFLAEAEAAVQKLTEAERCYERAVNLIAANPRVEQEDPWLAIKLHVSRARVLCGTGRIQESGQFYSKAVALSRNPGCETERDSIEQDIDSFFAKGIVSGEPWNSLRSKIKAMKSTQ